MNVWKERRWGERGQKARNGGETSRSKTAAVLGSSNVLCCDPGLHPLGWQKRARGHAEWGSPFPHRPLLCLSQFTKICQSLRCSLNHRNKVSKIQQEWLNPMNLWVTFHTDVCISCFPHCLDRSRLRKDRVILAHSLRGSPPLWTERNNHVDSQSGGKALNRDNQLTFSFSSVSSQGSAATYSPWGWLPPEFPFWKLS